MAVSAVVAARVAHRPLFEAAGPHLMKGVEHMTSRDVVEVCTAFATFGFRHSGLLGEVARVLPSMSLNDAEVRALQEAFARLEFDAPLLQRLRELRALGGVR